MGKETLNTNIGCQVQGKRGRKLKDKCQKRIYDARINQVDFTETRCLSIKKTAAGQLELFEPDICTQTCIR